MSVHQSGAARRTPTGRFRRPIVVCTVGTLLSELGLLLVFGLWLFPEGSVLGKALWTIAFCGIGMGLAVGTAIGWLVVGRYDGLRAILATTGLSVGILGVGCNALCFSIDRQLNHFGAVDRPVLWLASGLVLSIVGGLLVGAILFSSRGQKLLNRLNL